MRYRPRRCSRCCRLGPCGYMFASQPTTLVARLAANPEVRGLLQNDAGAQAAPVVLLRYRFGEVRLALFVVIASLHAPLDTRVEHLRVEFLMPADAATEQWFRAADAAEECSHATEAASDAAIESVRQPEPTFRTPLLSARRSFLPRRQNGRVSCELTPPATTASPPRSDRAACAAARPCGEFPHRYAAPAGRRSASGMARR